MQVLKNVAVNVALAGALAVAAVQDTQASEDKQQYALTMAIRNTGQSVSLAFTRALTGTLNDSGALLRIASTSSSFAYENTEVRTQGLSVMLGHQWITSELKYRAFFGLDTQERKMFSDEGSEASGTGLRALVQVNGTSKQSWSYSFQGSYATTRQNYQIIGRLGWPIAGVNIGPEYSVQGSQDYQSSRLALAISGISIGQTNHTIRVGHTEGHDEDGLGTGFFVGWIVSGRF
jgi:hypothetical protein